MRSYEDLEVWKAGIAPTQAVYRLTASFPDDEKFGLTSQLKRASVSVPTNIAEGWGRGPGASNVSLVRIARGSLYELKTLLVVAQKLEIGPMAQYDDVFELIESVRQLLHAYLKSMEVSVVREPEVAYGTG